MSTQPLDISIYAAVTEAIRAEAQRLLSTGQVSAIVGYSAARRHGSSQPVVISQAACAAKLIFTPACVNNLAVYLTKAKKEIPKTGKIGIVVKGCDLKALVGLMGESQLKREDLYLIGIPCAGVLASTIQPATELTTDSIAAKCRECDAHLPIGCEGDGGNGCADDAGAGCGDDRAAGGAGDGAAGCGADTRRGEPSARGDFPVLCGAK